MIHGCPNVWKLWIFIAEKDNDCFETLVFKTVADEYDGVSYCVLREKQYFVPPGVLDEWSIQYILVNFSLLTHSRS
jgi:hypothetical protein